MTGLSPESRPDTTAIVRLAEAAEVEYDGHGWCPEPGVLARADVDFARFDWAAVAELYAVVDPPTVIALCDALDTAERLLVSLLADLTEQYEKAREERDQHDEYSNYWRWLDGICEGLDRAIQRAEYPPDTTTNEPIEPDPFTDNDTDQEQT